MVVIQLGFWTNYTFLSKKKILYSIFQKRNQNLHSVADKAHKVLPEITQYSPVMSQLQSSLIKDTDNHQK